MLQVKSMPAAMLFLFALFTPITHINMKPFNEKGGTRLITRWNLGVIFIPHSVLGNSNTYCTTTLPPVIIPLTEGFTLTQDQTQTETISIKYVLTQNQQSTQYAQ